LRGSLEIFIVTNIKGEIQMTNTFHKATKENIKLRMALYGPPGCGKTYTALLLASLLGKRIGLIDTEYGSSRKYANLFNFDVLELTKFGPSQYYNAIENAEELGFDYLIIDSLSHAWYAQLQQFDIKSTTNIVI
jgi:predicted AAA+ superfamily ATPase